MKSITTLLCLSLATILNAQTFKVYKTNNVCVPTLTVLNGGTINETTTSNGTTLTKIMFKNISAQTHTYTVYRTILFNSPALDISCSNSLTPRSAFCFGYTAFPDCINTPGPSDYTILGPAGSTVSPTDNTCSEGTPFYIYLWEGPTLGQYLVGYKLQNVLNTNDTLSFFVNYNVTLGINELKSNIVSASVYPNPMENKATLAFDLKKESEITVKIYNEIGSLIYHSTEKYSVGTQTQSLDLTKFNSGPYFISVTNEGNKLLLSQKLIKN